MENVIEKINQFGSLYNELVEVVSNSKLYETLVASIYDLDINSSECISKLAEKKYGLYYFSSLIPKNQFSSLDDFGTQWGTRGSKNTKISDSPIYYKSRGKKHGNKIVENKYIPFYLGKAKDIKKRVNEHIFDSETSQTYSMKLGGRTEFLKDFKFKLGYLYLDVNSDSYFAIEIIEKYLRGRIHPIIGKQ